MTASMPSKSEVYAACLELIRHKIARLERALADLSEDAAGETKSSAGDKHETSRAMVQNEQEKISRQLHEASVQQVALEQMDVTPAHPSVRAGSLVATDKGLLFVGIALGRIEVAGDTVMALSSQSPLGLRLAGLRAGEQAAVNGTVYRVEKID